MYDYYVDPKKLDWELWEPKVPPFRYLKTMPFHKMIVPTVDTVRKMRLPRSLRFVRTAVPISAIFSAWVFVVWYARGLDKVSPI